MPGRPSILLSTKRRLWAESMGHCMNLDCQVEMVTDGVSIGQMAHIKEHADGGDVSFDNLLLLCGNCHTEIDATRTISTIPRLLEWKNNRQGEIRAHFTRRFALFREMEELVQPILLRNGLIFDSYGPAMDNSNNSARRDLWLKFEPEIIVNNQKLASIFQANRQLFHQENQVTVDSFLLHVEEFLATRDTEFPNRIVLFPTDINAMFGLGPPSRATPPPSVSALQNWITFLTSKDRFIELELTPRQLLWYSKEGQRAEMDLSNRPRMQQLYFNYRFYRPQTTEVRLNDLVYMLRWLDQRSVRYRWEDIRRLTELQVAGKYNVAFCYKYSLSSTDVYELAVKNDMIIVNLYGWNNSDIDKRAVAKTSEVGVHTLNQREFCEFIRLRKS